jgi:hypothetical protein
MENAPRRASKPMTRAANVTSPRRDAYALRPVLVQDAHRVLSQIQANGY